MSGRIKRDGQQNADHHPTVMLLFLDGGMLKKPAPDMKGLRVMLGRIS